MPLRPQNALAVLILGNRQIAIDAIHNFSLTGLFGLNSLICSFISKYENMKCFMTNVTLGVTLYEDR